MDFKIITNNLSGKGGLEVVIREMMTCFPNYYKDIKSSLIIIDDIPNIEIFEDLNNIKLFNNSLFSNLGKIGSALFMLIEIINAKERFIIGTSPKIIRYSKKIKKIFRKKYLIVSWIHFSLNEPFITKSDLLHADYHFSISPGLTKQFVDLQGHSLNVFTIFNPIKQQNLEISRPSYPIFLSIGRLVEQKNNIELLKAAEMLPQNKPWKIVFYGDGEKKDELVNFVIEKNLTDRVEFKGWVSDPWSEINEATALILTSHFEGFVMVVLEAISRGLPCICSNCPTGPADVINDANGFLYTPGKVTELAEKMIFFLNNSAQPKMRSSEIQKSINHLYEDAYFKRVYDALIEMDNRDSSLNRKISP